MPEIVLEKKGANGHHKFTLTVTETSYSIQDNTSTVSFSLKISKVQSGYDYNWGTNNPNAYDEVVTIDGTSYTAHNGKYDGSSVTTYISGTQPINHLTDGTKSIAVSFSVNDKTGQSYTSGDASASGTLALTNIPRYATSNQSLSSRTETSMTIAWSSDSTIDYVWYSKDNGSNWTAVGSVNATSGSYTISGLTANTSYTVKTRVRRKDSQLTTNSSGASWSTYSYPYISSVGTTNLTIGNSQTLTLYNPLSRIVTVYMKHNNTSGTQLYSGNTTIQEPTTKTFTPTASTMYGLIPNAKSGNCVYYLVYNDGTTNHTSATKSGTFVVNEENNKPTITSSTFVDTNTTTKNLTQDENKIVLNASNMKLTIVANAKNGATFNNNGYIKVNGTSLTLTISGSNATGVYTLNKPSSSSFSVVINDSRGISTSTTITMPSYVNYFIPTIIGNAKRNQPTNNIIDASASGTFFNGSFGSVTNYITSSYKVYNTTTSTLLTSGSFTISQSGNTHTEQEVQISNALYTEQYRVEFYVSDRINMTQSNVIVPKGVPIFNWDNDEFDVNVQLNANGLLQYGSSGRRDYSANGFTYDQYGNMTHRSSSSTNNWNMKSYDGTTKVQIYPETGDAILSGNLTLNKKLKIPKSNGSLGIYNSDDYPIIRDHGNTNVTVDATGSTLFLGYQNTTGLNILNGKGSFDSDGNMSITGTLNNIFLGTWSDNTSNYLANFRAFILSSSCRVGTSILTLGFNGQHLTGIIEKASSSYASAYLLSYTYRKHLRYLAGTWYDNNYAYTSELTQNVLSVRPSANISVTATGNQKITLNTQIFKSGSNLSISNGGILIGSGITKVFVSGSVYFSAGTNAGDSLRVLIYKNSSIVATCYARAGTSGTYEHRIISPYPITVAQGDYIYLYYSNSTAARGTVSSSSSDTYLVVSEIK